MKVHIIKANELTGELKKKWKDIQGANPDLTSPFFCPEFYMISSTYQRGIWIAVISDNNKVIGFFPFTINSRRIAKPVPMCDYQGIIMPKDLTLDMRYIMTTCRLNAWDFSQLISSQGDLCDRTYATQEYIRTVNLSSGYAPYERLFRQRSPSRWANLSRQMRKLEQEHGSVEYLHESNSKDILHTLLGWKSAKYNKGVMYHSTVTHTLDALHATHAADFKGVLSVLSAGGRVLAAHFGLRAKDTLHWWFPAFNPEFRSYSPGMLLLLETIKNSFSQSIRIIDLGAGNEPYKEYFSNDAVNVLSGSIEAPSLVSGYRNFKRCVKKLIKRNHHVHAAVKKLMVPRTVK